LVFNTPVNLIAKHKKITEINDSVEEKNPTFGLYFRFPKSAPADEE
jgi:hypothetical protein